MAIKDIGFLEEIDRSISSSSSESDFIELTKEQKIMLVMSEEDIKNGDLISQEEMGKINLKWLNGM